MKHFLPFRIQVSPFNAAVDCIPKMSEPPEGSVMATHPMVSPRARGGRYFFFWASVPKSLSAGDGHVVHLHGHGNGSTDAGHLL